MGAINNNTTVEFLDTKFIFKTNFQGNPMRDSFKSNECKGNIIINDNATAAALMAEGFNVKQSNPTSEKFQPQWYIPVKLKFKDDLEINDGRQPKVVLVVNGKPVRLDKESMHLIDDAQDNHQVSNVKVMCSKYYNQDRGTKSLYIRVMYVEQSDAFDPYANLYDQVDSGYDSANDIRPW